VPVEKKEIRIELEDNREQKEKEEKRDIYQDNPCRGKVIRKHKLGVLLVVCLPFCWSLGDQLSL